MSQPLDAKAEMLRGRLTKNARHLAKWARREHIDCYRVYDVDIPEIPLFIDRYGQHVVMADRRSFLEGLPEEDAWLDVMREVCHDVLGAEPHIKRRERKSHRAGDQYERSEEAAVWAEVSEGPARFIVNLDGYLDTGLFLDHRITRAKVAAEASGKRLLNLFCYTGAFTVHAGLAGASSSVSVDMSRTYTDWAQQNFDLNGLSNDHQLICSDVMAYLAAFPGARFDLAVVDPPTFSNSKKMTSDWDVQRDHEMLLARVARLMSPGGVIWFSTNSRRFRLGSVPGDAEDFTEATRPPDFRDAKVHRAWRIQL